MSNYCKNNCLYCGIRAANKNISRYRLTKGQVLGCAVNGYELGFRTFVLQGGEDTAYSDKDICDMVRSIKELFPDCAVTLSIGEKSYESYKAYREAGADRYLLRHETATKEHYKQLHPETMSFENRLRCLQDLKALGYQVGSGFMVGSPYQTPQDLITDLRFLQEIQPDMIGIGPFIPHHQTPFANKKQGELHLTLRMLSILRLMFPKALLPSTTALGSIEFPETAIHYRRMRRNRTSIFSRSPIKKGSRMTPLEVFADCLYSIISFCVFELLPHRIRM